MSSRSRAFQYLLEPTVNQRKLLDELLVEQCRLYNAALEERRGAWRLERRSVTRFDQYKTLTGLAEQEPALMAFGVTVARGTLLRLDRAFGAFYRRVKAGQTPGFPRFRPSRRFDSVEWPDTIGWKLDEGTHRIYLQGVGHVKLRLHRPLRGTPKTITVRRIGRRWQVTLFCVDVPTQPLPATGVDVGIDLGVTHLAALSTGAVVQNPRHLRSSEDRLARAQQIVSGRRRGSARRRRSARLVGLQHRKIRNQRRDFLHKLSRSLVNDHDLIAIEKLHITNMTRRPKPRPDGEEGFAPNGAAAKGGLNKSILDAGWGILIAMLTYKAEDAGRQLVAVNPRYTSQTCSDCGLVDENNRHGSMFECGRCGHRGNADVNAAINILRAGQALRLEREANRVVA